MAFDDEPAYAGSGEEVVRALRPGALGQPEALRLDPEHFGMGIAAGADLRAEGGWMRSQERQDGVCGSAGNEFDPAGLLEPGECADNIALYVIVKAADGLEAIEVKESNGLQFLLKESAVRLRLGQADEAIEVCPEAILQERVPQRV